MSGFWNIFKQYFLIDLLVYGGFLIFVGIGVSNDNNWSLKYYLLYFGLFIPLLVFITGSFGLLKYEVWRPTKIRKKLALKPFTYFKNRNFKQFDRYLIGKINGYYVCVGIEWENYQKKPAYYYKVLYNPKSLGRFITLNEFIKFNNELETNSFYINPSSIEKSYTRREFSKLQHRDILKDINKMIDFLKMNELNSIDYNKWKLSLSTVDDLESEYLSEVYL